MGPDWDWRKSIEVYGAELREVLAGMFLMLGLAVTGDGVPRRVSRVVWRAVLGRLRPAEAALRRVIVMAARGVDVSASAVGERRDDSGSRRKGSDDETCVQPFALFDERRKVGVFRRRAVPKWREPRISSFDDWEPRPPRPPLPCDDDPVDVAALLRRLRAMGAALDDIPAQARRMARAMARRRAQGRTHRPMRPGRPPGHRERHGHRVDGLLAECQTLALWALHIPGRGQATTGGDPP